MSVLPAPFKKLHTEIKERLTSLEITTPTPFQISSIPVIKSGANVFCKAPKDSGKTTSLILTTLHKLKFQAVGTAVRAIVLVEDSEKIEEMYQSFQAYTRYTELRIYAAVESLHVDTHKSEILEGTDVLIITATGLHKLLLSNGISTSQLTIFSIDDAEFITKNNGYATILAITQGVKKCQFVLYSEEITPKLKGLDSYFMEFAKTVSI